ncbi:MAG: hypothetical protein ACFFA4_10750 [Promethearchaeota archaeon]
MINETFKNNWLKILKFNANREILEDPNKVMEKLRIPFSPISINPNLLYRFFELLYPRFINDQQNILDIIISDEEKKNKVQSLFLYTTKKAGIHENFEPLPNNIIRIKSLESENLDELFDKAQKAILKEKKIQISSIRLFREEAIDLINKHCEGIEDTSIYEFLERSMDFIQKIINRDLILIYPEPIVINFLRNFLKFVGKTHLRTLFKIIEEIFPEFNISLLVNGTGFKVIIHLQKQILKSGKSSLTVNFLTPDELEITLNDSDLKETLNLIQKKLKTENTYYLNQNGIISFTSDLIELSIPLKKDNTLFLLQKALFGYRSFQSLWDMVPRPKIYNTLIRFIIRLFGFNVNLKKLSHWAIPDLIFNYIDFYIGLNSRILFVISDQEKNKNGKITRSRVNKNIYNHMFLLYFENSTLKNIIKITNEELFSGLNNSIFSIKQKLTEQFGYITAVIIFDKHLLQNIIKYFLISHSKFTFFPRFKTLKMLKNEKYFNMYPEFPFYKLIKKRRTITLAKLLLPIIIDKHEF